jgi:hypothetical protein
MPHRIVGLFLLGALAGCGGGSGPGPEPLTARSQGTTLTTESARSALSTAAGELVSGTGRFKQVITISSAGATVSETYDGSFDGSRKVWASSFVAQQGSDPIGSLQLIGSANALYLTSPAWPEGIRGRWYRFTPANFDSAAGALAQGQRITDTPDAVFAVSAAKATGGQQLAAGTTLEAELPASEAVGLGGLRTGLGKLKIDAQSLTGRARVRVLLGDDGRVQQLTMARGALHPLAAQLPASIRVVADGVAVSVQFTDLGAPVEIALPAAGALLPSQG